MGAVRAYYEKMGDKFVNALNEMLVFDAVICNVDRHFGNFGVMVDNRTNTIVKYCHSHMRQKCTHGTN